MSVPTRGRSVGHDGVLPETFEEPGAFFAAVLGALGEAVFVVRPSDRRIMMCNGAAERLFGRSRDELVGSTTELLYASEEDFRRLATRSEAELREGRAYRGQFPFQKATGEGFEAQVVITAVDPDDWTAGVVSVLHDITVERELMAERARMEERRNALERLASLGELAGGVAHDINNLLLPILVNVELALPEAEGELVDLLTEVREAALGGRDLTRKLLTFAQQQRAEKTRVDLREILRSTEPVLRSIAGRGAALEISTSNQPLMVVADPALLEQMLVSLVSNARDAAGDGGRIVVTTTLRDVKDAGQYGRTGATGAYAYVVVEDDGPGIRRELRDRIFEPFFSTKEEKGSTGLGLSSALGIVVQHEGHIVVDDGARGGARVSVGLPISPKEESRPGGGSEAGSGHVDGSGHTVLVVEDDEAVRRVTARALRSFGYTVVEASDGPTALETVDSMDPAPDVIVSDMVMPHMSGLELRARLERRVPGVPVVFVSGYSWTALQDEGIDPAALDIVPKPFSPAQLARAVATALATSDGSR